MKRIYLKEENKMRFWDDKLKIEPIYLINFLAKNGFQRFKYDDKELKPNIIQQVDNKLNPFNEHNLLLFCCNYVKKHEFEDKSVVLNNLVKGTNLLTNRSLTALPEFNSSILRDTSSSSYFPFKNGVVEVKSNSISLNKYGEFEKFVWEKHIIDHDVKVLSLNKTLETSVFYKFLKDICESSLSHEASRNRYERLISMLGYLMHNYRDKSNSKSIIFMDDKIDGNPNGGTGKGILLDAIDKLRKVTKIDGKSLDLNQRFAFQQVELDTEIVQFDDVERNFNFEKLFPAITEGVSVEKKGKDKILIPFEKSPKIAITTNYAINGSGSSHRRRKLEFDLTSYYSDKYSPYDKFNHLFFQDWDTEQWNSFYNLMLHITRFYLKNDIVEYNSEILEAKHVLNETSQCFVEFVKKIKIGVTYNKNELYKKYVEAYKEKDAISPNRFTKYLKSLAEIKGKKYSEGHSNSDYYFEIR
ncbi:hypothetical protein GF376_02740 [Candidatus Peregrinibacteria bacterium]|nr:hypothetical protein [Candidatus Peregrinibacteria bacterium]